MNYLKTQYLYLFFICIFLFPPNTHAEFVNTNGEAIDKPFTDLLKWQFSKNKTLVNKINTSSEWREVIKNNANNYTIWIGHSTFIIKTEFGTVLTDPVFSQRASPFSFAGPERLIDPAIQINELPKIDYITISHNHYDHLDIKSLVLLSKRFPDAIFLVPMGDKKLLDKNLIGGMKLNKGSSCLPSHQSSTGQQEGYLIKIKVFGVDGFLKHHQQHSFMPEILVIQKTLN
jgi:predicted metal-dependent RNase